MKRFTTSAAALVLASAPVLADDYTAANANTVAMGDMQADLIRSRDITGGTIYTTNPASESIWDPVVVYDAVGTDWTDIGEIEDLVLSRDGKLTGIVAEVGGFLDIGDKHVVISVDDVNLVAVDDNSYAYVTRLTAEQLEMLPEVDEGLWN